MLSISNRDAYNQFCSTAVNVDVFLLNVFPCNKYETAKEWSFLEVGTQFVSSMWAFCYARISDRPSSALSWLASYFVL